MEWLLWKCKCQDIDWRWHIKIQFICELNNEHHRNVFIMWHLHCAIHEKYEKTHNYFIAVSRLIGERTID